MALTPFSDLFEPWLVPPILFEQLVPCHHFPGKPLRFVVSKTPKNEVLCIAGQVVADIERCSLHKFKIVFATYSLFESPRKDAMHKAVEENSQRPHI